MSDNNDLFFSYSGDLVGHRDTVTCISTAPGKAGSDAPILISGSRDKSLMIWQIDPEESKIQNESKMLHYGYPLKSLTGHNHFVSDIALNADASIAISSSWDKTLRLWNIKHGKSIKCMTGHTSEVLSVALSQDSRFILSAGCDKDVRLWNTLGECKFTTTHDNHNDWVSTIKFSPSPKYPYFASAGWDGRLKIWDNKTFKIKYSFKAHEGAINSLTVAPNGSKVATGGRDCLVKVWKYTDMTEADFQWNAGAPVNAVAFNPQLQWVAAGTENSIRVWDMEEEDQKKFACELKPEHYGNTKSKVKGKVPACTSLCWSPDGHTLFSGHADGNIRAWTYIENTGEN